MSHSLAPRGKIGQIHTLGWPPFAWPRLRLLLFTTEAQESGIGLGLVTVRGIVKKYDGLIAVECKLNPGTCFRVYLPRINDLVERPGATDKTFPLMGKGQLLLIVDDEDGIRQTDYDILSSNGHQALSAADGIKALDQRARSADRIAVLLTDLDMPRLGGTGLILGFR